MFEYEIYNKKIILYLKKKSLNNKIYYMLRIIKSNSVLKNNNLI